MRIRCLFLLVLLLQLAPLVGGYSLAAAQSQSVAVNVTPAHPAVSLTGSWHFRTGDDARWALADIDDNAWETVDLTPPPGARDGDVGITNYLHGWRAHGHKGYWGYAWYRQRISTNFPLGPGFALLAPSNVEDAYQVFCDGKLIGQSGDFSGKTPVITSPKPRMFSLAPCAMHQGGDAVISIRTWMGPQTERDDDAGGIHVAPAIGEESAIAAMYHDQWMEIIWGYIVDAIEPAVFLLLAVLAWWRARRSPKPAFSIWLGIALLLTTLVRGNQSFFAWLDVESLDSFMIAKYVILMPTVMAAWAMTWLCWLAPAQRQWKLIAQTIVLCLAATMIASAKMGEGMGSFGEPPRLAMALLFLIFGVLTAISKRSNRTMMIVTVTLVAIGQFAGELSSLGIPGIWFPFGVGVSRTQYAYAALIPCLFWLMRFEKARLYLSNPLQVSKYVS